MLRCLSVAHRSQNVASLRRRGFTLVELMLALSLLGIFFAVFTPLLLGVARERREAVREQVAWQQAQNLLEELTHRPWNDVTAAAALPELTAAEMAYLPAYQQRLVVTEIPGPPLCKRVTVSVSWKMRSDAATERVLSLSGWVWPDQESRP